MLSFDISVEFPIVKEVSKLAAIQIERVADVCIDWWLEGLAVNVQASQHHLRGRYEVCVLVDKVMNSLEAFSLV